MSPLLWTRREALALGAGAFFGLPAVRSHGGPRESGSVGRVEGWPEAAAAGEIVLANGGNAVDAIVTAALVASVVAPQMCGPGGYGGHCIVAVDGGTKLAAIDFNTAAPAALREDSFPVDPAGRAKGNVNSVGWLAAGVPGTLAGMQLLLDRFGTLSFARAVEPAIRYARDGFRVGTSLANSLRSTRSQLQKDLASAQLLLPDDDLPKVGAILRNPDLAAMLESLAKHGSVEPFYRGEFAERIAGAFRQNGGLVTEADLAAYRAREVQPLELAWNGSRMCTPPPTSGGLTVLETLAVLKAIRWDEWSADDFRCRRALLEALRLTWRDRLQYLGDPEHADVPIQRLLSSEHVQGLADEVQAALRSGQPVSADSDGRAADGTVHLSAADSHGNFAALTLTHGGSFGARVTVPGLGLTLGHGMSRFEPRPGHPNSPGPGKRPLHNMCPTVVLRDGRAALAIGGRGGRKIPNAVAQVLARNLGLGESMKVALAAPRLHTEGDLSVQLEPKWPDGDAARLKAIGYAVRRAGSATVSAVWNDLEYERMQAGTR